MTFKSLILAGASLALVACGGDAAKTATDMADKAEMAMKVDSAKLATILAAQPDKAKARYDARNPQATLEFFGIAQLHAPPALLRGNINPMQSCLNIRLFRKIEKFLPMRGFGKP